MRKKLLSLVLAACLVLSLLPALSLPAEAGSMTRYAIGETSIGYATNLSSNIVTNVTGDGWTWTHTGDAATGSGTLTLTSAYIKGADDASGDSYGAKLPGGTTIVLNGDSTIAGGTASYESCGISCEGTMTVEGTGSLSAVGGNGENSYGIISTKLNISSGKLTTIGGTASGSSYGVNSGTVTIGGSADMTAVGGTAGVTSYGVYTCFGVDDAVKVTGGSLTAVGGYAGSSTSAGIYRDDPHDTMTVSGGTVVAQGGKSANGDSYGVFFYVTLTISGGLLAASSDACGTGRASEALSSAPTGETNSTVLVGAYNSSFAVYGDSTTYTSNNILTSTLDLRNRATSTWSNSSGLSGWMWNAAQSTLTLKNTIICGADKSGSGEGAFGILGWGNISIVYEGVDIVCGGASANGSSYGVEIEADKNGDRLALSGGGTLVALGRKAGDSSYGIQFLDPEETGSLQVTSGKLIALGGSGGTSAASDTGSCGLNVSKNLYINSGNVTAVGGAATGSGSISGGIICGAGISMSNGQLVAVGGYASGTDSVSGGVCSLGTTIFSGDANAVAVGDGYGIAAYSMDVDEETGDVTMTDADFQLGTNAADTATLTARGGTSAANGKAVTTVSGKAVACDGGTCATAGAAVRFHLADAVIAVAHDGSNFTNYANFADGWNEAVGTSNTANTAVKLLADWTATYESSHSTSLGSGVGFYDGTNQAGSICVPSDKRVILDLNGHTIDRNLSEPCINAYGGWVIANLGTLTIRDSGTGGTITGGYTGLYVNGGKSGGGIYNAGTLTLSGGTIAKNADGERGGGVYNTGTFTMTGGKISANLAATGEGGSTCGGGVYNAAGAVFTMTGGEISGNYSCDTTKKDGGGVYNAGTFYVGGTAKITGNFSKATYDYNYKTVSGGETDNVYLPSNAVIACLAGTSALTSGASIGVTTADTPVTGTPVAVTGSNSADYSGYFHSDLTTYRIQNSGSSPNQVVQLAVMPRSDIFDAKFYQPQLWDCQRSPAFPVAGRSFRLSGLKAPYDQNLRKVNFADPARDYVTFEYVKDVSALDAATQTRIVNSLKRYTGATAEQIKAAVVVKEVLHSGTNQTTETTLSSVGLVWALGEDGFLYTAMDGALKYSGGVGTYVTFAAHKSGESIIYTPDKTEPYTYEETTADNNKLAPEDGAPTAPAAVTYQELIRVVDGSGTAVSGAAVTITVDDKTYSGTTDANGCVQFPNLPVQEVTSATVQSGSYAALTYNSVDSPEAVLTYTNPSNVGPGTQQDNVKVTVNTTGSGTVTYLGAGTSAGSPYSLTSGDTAMFTIKPASGYYVSAAAWGSTDILTTAKTGVYRSGAVTADTTLTVTFTAIEKTSIFDIQYTTAQVFDVQRSPAFPDTGNSAICFSWLDQPYDTNLEHITLKAGQYIKFDKVSSVDTAGKTDEYTESLRWWTDAQQISTAALVEENVYNADGTKVKTLGTGLIWCYNDPSKGFMFTTMDGVLGGCGGVGSYVSFNALRCGSSVTQLTDSAEPLQWGTGWAAGTTSADDPQGQPQNPTGDTVDDTQDVTFDFAGKVLNDVTPRTVVANTDVTLTWGGTDYAATTDSNGRFVASSLPYGENGSYTVTISGTTFTGELPDLGGVENSKTRTATLTAPEIVFLLPSGGTTGTVATPYTITVTKTGSGSVSPLGTATVNDGGSVRVFFTASSGYTLSEVKIDGTPNAEAKTNGHYIFTGVTSDHTVAVTFTSSGGGEPSGPNTFVPPEAEPHGYLLKIQMDTGIDSVPAEITAADPTLGTPAAVESKLKVGIDKVLGTTGSVTVKNFDLSLWVSQDEGATWTRATVDNFPTGGITVVIPWQELGLTYEQAQHISFSVTHMFAASVNGHTPGTTENPVWIITADGLRFTAGGLSPFAIGYKALPQITFDANGGSTNTTDTYTAQDGKLASLPTPTRSNYTFDGWYTAAVGGDKITADTVFSVNATAYAHWTANAALTADGTTGTTASGTDVTAPKTGDTSNIVLWASLMLAGALGLAAFFAWHPRKDENAK